MGRYEIPFNKTSLLGNEIEYTRQAIRQEHISGNGPFTKKCEALLMEALECAKCILTTSCTHALEMAALLLEIKPGDEVIVPSFTFPSTVTAFAIRGARPVFIDVRPDTLNLDETKLESLIGPHTKAIVPVHYAGIGCEMESILATAEAAGVPVVEDNAHGLFGRYRGKPLGNFGALATQSFHETKNFSCGEGGALVVNDRRFVDRAEIVSEKGTDRRQFERGLVEKYRWVDLGSSYLPSDLLAAFLYAQLEKRDDVQRQRKQSFETYDRLLRHYAEATGIQLPTIPPDCEPSYHLYYVLLPNEAMRDRAISALAAEGILAVFHYVPLHESPAGRKYGGEQECPVTTDISSRLLRLPFYYSLTVPEQERVVDVLIRSIT